MPWRLRFDIALRQTLDPGKGLSAFLSRIAIVGMALAIAILLTVQSVMNGFDLEMRERILSLVPPCRGHKFRYFDSMACAGRTARA